MHHSDQGTSGVVHEREGFGKKSQLNPEVVQQALALQHDKPRIGSHQETRPERNQNRDHAQVRSATWQLRNEICQWVPDQDTNQGCKDTDFECGDENSIVRLAFNEADVVLESETSVRSYEGSSEEPANRNDDQQDDEEQIGDRQAHHHQFFFSFLLVKRFYVGLVSDKRSHSC